MVRFIGYDAAMILELASAERRALRARAHALDPVVMVGDAGLTTPVMNEIHRNLASHELIKVRVMAGAHAARDHILTEICTTLHAAPIQHIGKILVVYRPRPAEAVTAAKKKTKSRPKPPRRTKRSFQH
ncbi:MAG: YhbY family RNA-binding protein [Betaproteobacteria bacterium]